MRARDIVVVGASAGGVTPLRAIVARLPATFQAAVFVVTHRYTRHLLAQALASAGTLPVGVPLDLERIVSGRIYVAPADTFMLLENGVIRIERSPKDFIYRPSINMLFRSAAAVYGRRVVGVILSGTLSDGVAGLWEIHKRGGLTIVQEPGEAQFSDMPINALTEVPVDYTLPACEIAQTLVELSAAKSRNGDGRVKVLVVEDERIVAQNLCERLEEMGYGVCACVASGNDAITAAGQHDPDVVLMDIRLAGPLSGIEAARGIWSRSQTPIVYLTAYDDELTLAEAKTTECYGYVVKPFHSNAIRAVLELALDRREKETRAITTIEE